MAKRKPSTHRELKAVILAVWLAGMAVFYLFWSACSWSMSVFDWPVWATTLAVISALVWSFLVGALELVVSADRELHKKYPVEKKLREGNL